MYRRFRFGLEFLQKGFHQGRDVFLPLTEGGEIQLKHIEAIVEVPAELSGFYQLLQISVGGGNDPDVDGDDFAVAQPHDFPLLQYPQQPPLEAQRDFGNFIQKDRSVMGNFEKTGLSAFGCAGKGTLCIAEKLTFQQVFRQRRAVDRHKIVFCPAAPVVDALADQFLAGSGFAYQHDVGVCERIGLGLFQALLHTGTAGNHMVKGIFCGVSLAVQGAAQLVLRPLDLGGIEHGDDAAGREAVHKEIHLFYGQVGVFVFDDLIHIFLGG